MNRPLMPDSSGAQLAQRFCRALCAMVILIPALAGSVSAASVAPDATDPGEATYRIEQELIRLTGGRAEKEAVPGVATRAVTTLVEELVSGDLNGDGVEDAAVWLLHQPGGTGSVLYMAVALNIGGHYVGTNAVFVGDRIVPQVMCIRNGVLSITYIGRRNKESNGQRQHAGKSSVGRRGSSAGRLLFGWARARACTVGTTECGQDPVVV